jgi:hypothetical protein
MYIRAKMDAFLDPSAGGLDSISAEPLRTWRVTGTDEAIEAFRSAVGGVVVPDEDIVGVLDAAVVAQQVAKKQEQVAVLQANLDAATAELTDLQKVAAVTLMIPVELVDVKAT